MTTKGKIDVILASRNMSRRQLAISCNIPPSTFQSYMEDNGKSIPSKFIEKIVKYLDITYADVLDDSIAELQFKSPAEFAEGYFLGVNIPVSPSTERQRKILECYNMLNPTGQREALVRIREMTMLSKYTNDPKCKNK